MDYTSYELSANGAISQLPSTFSACDKMAALQENAIYGIVHADFA